MNKETYKQLYAAFLSFKGIGFVSFQHKNKSGQVSKILLNVGASYNKARLEDMVTLDLGVRFLRSPFYTRADWNEALYEIKEELQKTATVIKDKTLSPCLLLHNQNDSLRFSHRTHSLYVFGKIQRSTILRTAGTHRPTHPVSIAKQFIEDSYLKTSHFKLFLLKGMQGIVKVNKQAIHV